MPFSMKPSSAICITLVFAAGQRALAVNDWSVPCTQGKCSWDLPADSGSSGSVDVVSFVFIQSYFSGPFADMKYLCIHSGVLSAQFRTLRLPLDGKLLRNATRLAQNKKSSSCARTTIQIVITSSRAMAQ